jgi:hypothetical protein
MEINPIHPIRAKLDSSRSLQTNKETYEGFFAGYQPSHAISILSIFHQPGSLGIIAVMECDPDDTDTERLKLLNSVSYQSRSC